MRILEATLIGGGVKSVSESSDQLVFPSEDEAPPAAKEGKQPPVLSESAEDADALDSHVGFEDQEILDESPAGEGASVFDDHDDDEHGKDSGYFDRLKSVFGDQ